MFIFDAAMALVDAFGALILLSFFIYLFFFVSFLFLSFYLFYFFLVRVNLEIELE